MSDIPLVEPEVRSADLGHAILLAIADPGHYPVRGNNRGERSVSEWSRDAVLQVLDQGGWVVPGVPPVDQVLADARRLSDQLVLSNLVARFFRVLILGAVIVPDTPAAMDWLRDYIDGSVKPHGPLGGPMVWPDRLPQIAGLLRQWGFQPTPTQPPFVSMRPGGAMAPIDAADPEAPDPASVSPLAQGREANLGALLDETAGATGAMAVDRMTALRAMSAAFDRGATHAEETSPEIASIAGRILKADADLLWKDEAAMRQTVADAKRLAGSALTQRPGGQG